MTKNAKIYLITSLGLVTLGGIAILTKQAAAMPVLYVPFPVGAVFFGLFLVSAFLGKEAEQFTKEQHAREQAADRQHEKH
jgi:FtsH-binding integral membrane protein